MTGSRLGAVHLAEFHYLPLRFATLAFVVSPSTPRYPEAYSRTPVASNAVAKVLVFASTLAKVCVIRGRVRRAQQ